MKRFKKKAPRWRCWGWTLEINGVGIPKKWRPNSFERLVYSLPTLEQRDRILKCIMEAIKSQK